MHFLKTIFFTAVFSASCSANALLVSDVHEVNAALISGESAGVFFNLADHGYNHLTDTITNIKLSFDFKEIVETEEDFEDWYDMSNWEFIIFYSWIFDGRSIYSDVDTGILTFESGWAKNYDCQASNSVDGDVTCLENLDLNGEMASWFVPYTDNLWLGEVRLDAEITRTSVPEPASVFLMLMGVIVLGIQRQRVKNR